MSLLRGRLRAEGLAHLGWEDTLIVWQYCDGKAGHDNQSTGLIEALSEIRPLETITLPPLSPARAACERFSGYRLRGAALPDPDLIIGAGHRTHLSMLAARHARGGRIIVLMKPGLPLAWFDLCIIPRHDMPPRRDNVLVTQGVLTRLLPEHGKIRASGLILLGGPSRHVAWDRQRVFSQIAAILAQEPDRHWKLCASRRTPSGFWKSFLSHYPGLSRNAEFYQDTNTEWLPQQLAGSPLVWVTEDSVSMICEALGARARVGLIELPHRRENRISRGVDDLVRGGWAVRYEDWRAGIPLPLPVQPLRESRRVALEIAERWLNVR